MAGIERKIARVMHGSAIAGYLDIEVTWGEHSPWADMEEYDALQWVADCWRWTANKNRALLHWRCACRERLIRLHSDLPANGFGSLILICEPCRMRATLKRFLGHVNGNVSVTLSTEYDVKGAEDACNVRGESLCAGDSTDATCAVPYRALRVSDLLRGKLR